MTILWAKTQIISMKRWKKVKKVIGFEKSQGKNSADCISMTI